MKVSFTYKLSVNEVPFQQCTYVDDTVIASYIQIELNFSSEKFENSIFLKQIQLHGAYSDAIFLCIFIEDFTKGGRMTRYTPDSCH